VQGSDAICQGCPPVDTWPLQRHNTGFFSFSPSLSVNATMKKNHICMKSRSAAKKDEFQKA
jgi:hypothetical protein